MQRDVISLLLLGVHLRMRRDGAARLIADMGSERGGFSDSCGRCPRSGFRVASLEGEQWRAFSSDAACALMARCCGQNEEQRMTSNASPQGNADLTAKEQEYGTDPLKVRETGQYRSEYVKTFAEKWDELIDWDARAASEGDFFIDILRARGKHKVLDVAAGTGFHSVRLIQAGFDVTTVDGSAAMLAKAFENGKERQIILKTV